MKKTSCLFVLALLAVSAIRADDQTRNAQSQLKTQGFYYGDVNGQVSSEMTAAIRRYQIRNGLEVTGTLNTETLDALGLGGPKPPAQKPPAPVPTPDTQQAAKKPPVNLRKDESVEESDREFLKRDAGRNPAPQEPLRSAPSLPSPVAPRDPSVVSPPVTLEAPSGDYPVLFANTPYANAPREVQQQTLRRAQYILATRGFYRDVVDGLPGPATEEALLGFQRSARLVLTGRLDLETLSELRLLPGRQPLARPSAPGSRVYRGIWVN
jgi:peptidoglycan hydrolase-like protein with peptidoglycan-binding domain